MEYKKPYKLERTGDYGGLGVQISIAIERELTDEDHRIISKACETISEAIMERTIALSPKAKEEAANQREKLLAPFPKFSYVEELPNGYCSQYCCKHLPWFQVTTPIGRIVIGVRKRVINIDWTDTRVQKSGEELFPDLTTTRSAKYEEKRYIHAWSYEDAATYINKLLEEGASAQNG